MRWLRLIKTFCPVGIRGAASVANTPERETEEPYADAAQLLFEGRRFDVGTITTVMPHGAPPSRCRICLSEASRVVKRGGRLLRIDYEKRRRAA